MSAAADSYWSDISGLQHLGTPGLLFDLDRIGHNIRTMIQTVGGPDHVGRLRPHVKTVKSSTIIRMQVDAGIRQFKAATVSEARAAAMAGADDVMLAHQLPGVKFTRLLQLAQSNPRTLFSTVVDNAATLTEIEQAVATHSKPFPVWIDVDCGMHRTGIELGDGAAELQSRIERSPVLKFAGLHVYDGHIHDADIDARQRQVDTILDSIRDYTSSHACPAIVCGGSPTFGLYAAQTDYQCSPGTNVLWDIGYANSYAEMPHQIAAALVTRVISHPTANTWCLDLGYKAVASEMPLPQRVMLPSVPDAMFCGHSEEHMVIETERPLSIGQTLVSLPKHICPSVALYGKATIIENGCATDRIIEIDARDR
ncbi:alanine racemase [Stieleria varia]|uniref:D-threonine aldolase n=1 Tax=Stieleria varia TaxID=2528005 RepID=A0A5C6AST2_9BACT|nr:alanine racemase [Stieleria varia]TWU02126.1 D-threonine aldolase [Stieleria varia]